MNHPTPITVFDYAQEPARLAGFSPHAPLAPDTPFPGGCEICQAPITVSSAYLAQFGTVRCSQCIGNDGFATPDDLDLFRQTATLPCPGCGQAVLPAEISPDGNSCTYHCYACGTTAHYTTPTVA